MTAAARLSLGQLSVWRDIHDLPPERRHEPNNAVLWPLPEEAGADRVARALRGVVARHSSLRTRYDLKDADAPRQLPPDADFRDALPATEVEGGEPEEVVAQSVVEPFDLGREHSWRARLLTRYGVPAYLLFVKHHIAADAWAQELLRAEFLQALGTPQAAPVEAPGPAALAAEQFSAAGLRRQAAALDYWVRVLSEAPTASLPPTSGDYGSLPQEALHVTLRSAAARRAAQLVAGHAQVPASSVVLAAYVRSVGRACDIDPVLVQLMSANRFVPRWKRLVTSMNQWAPALITAAPPQGLPAAARNARWSSLSAFRHGMYDVAALARLRASTPGLAEPACAFNYVAAPAGPLATRGDRPATPEGPTTLTWKKPFTTLGPRCYARVSEDDQGALTIRLTAKDLSRDQAAGLLWDMHDYLIAAAARL